MKIIISSLLVGFMAGFYLGMVVKVAKRFHTPIEVYCPIVEGRVTGKCYQEFHVDGNCASLPENKIHCGEAYLLEVGN